jgi:hypothetical protein
MWFEFLTAIFAPLAGVGLGAWLAFRNERRHRVAEKRDADVTSLNLAVHALSEIWNITKDLQAQMVDPVRDHPVRWVALRPCPEIRESVEFDTGRLAFLFENGHTQLPAMVALELRRFAALRQMVEEHARWHGVRLQERVAAAGLQKGATEQELADACGPHVKAMVEALANGIFESVDANVHSTRRAADALADAGRQIFPDRTVIRFLEDGEAPPSRPKAWYEIPPAELGKPW